MPPSSSSSTCLFISSLWSCGNLYCRVFIGRSSVVGIWCYNILVAVNFSPGIWNLSWLLNIRFIMFFFSRSFRCSKRNNSTISVCLFLFGFSDNVKHSNDILSFSALSFCFDLHLRTNFSITSWDWTCVDAGIFEDGLLSFS